MKIYLVQDAPASVRWHASLAEAKKIARAYGCEVDVRRVAEEGREQLAEFLNARELFVQPAGLELPPRPETAQDQQNEVLMDFNPGDDNRVRDRFQPQEHRLAERAAFLGTSEEIALLTDRIGELDGWPLGQVALAAATRLKELADVQGS